tara:strand:+ start:166 stop:462 length:297 start_codon:yes stop_codon:yes gene_type:complete
MAISKLEAIQSLVPNAKCGLLAGEIVSWNSEEAQPSEEEITAEQERLQAEYDALAWKRNRQSEYPSVLDCIHALLDGGDTLTDLQAARQAVKDKYPKG